MGKTFYAGLHEHKATKFLGDGNLNPSENGQIFNLDLPH